MDCVFKKGDRVKSIVSGCVYEYIENLIEEAEIPRALLKCIQTSTDPSFKTIPVGRQMRVFLSSLIPWGMDAQEPQTAAVEVLPVIAERMAQEQLVRDLIAERRLFLAWLEV